MKNISILFFGFIFLCFGCGDMFAARTKITGHYFLFQEDGCSDFSIRYKLSAGDFIGRIPSKVIEYGFMDSILVAKSVQFGKVKFYILNMKADFEYADEKDYLIDTFSNNSEYVKKWANIPLKKLS